MNTFIKTSHTQLAAAGTASTQGEKGEVEDLPPSANFSNVEDTGTTAWSQELIAISHLVNCAQNTDK